MDKTELQTKVDAIPEWYHAIDLGNGIITPGDAPINALQYGIPADLTGKRVLDVGAWDGYWTFEALKRGASKVLAIENFSDTAPTALSQTEKMVYNRDNKWQTFDLCREALGYTDKQAQRVEVSVYDLSEKEHGLFDVIFFFGTLYHCKYPQLALDKLSVLLTEKGRIYIESAICDDYSPYQGGMGHGHKGNVVEVYPGDQYGRNPSNYWVPTLSALGCMLQISEMKNIDTWKLQTSPSGLECCRGFACGTKSEDDTDARGPGVSEVEVSCDRAKPLSIGAIMSVPRLGFMDNFFCIFEALPPLGIQMRKQTGAFWGQCIERGLEHLIDVGLDVMLTVDYDTVFTQRDVLRMIDILANNPEIEALASLQVGRGGLRPLITQKGKSGAPKLLMTTEEMKQETCQVATAHFGLTMIRTASLLQMPHPWFQGVPDSDGRWGDGRIDPDIYFWKQWEKNGHTLHLANRVVIGHSEGGVILWPDKQFDTIYQLQKDYHEVGKPAEAWE